MIHDLVFMENGNVGAFDEEGQQVPVEQVPSWLTVIREKLRRGVIEKTTRVLLPWGTPRPLDVTARTVEELLKEHQSIPDPAPRTWTQIGADRLADEVAVLVRRGIIDSRSPAADALLDYRDPPSSPRADRLAELETAMKEADRLVSLVHDEIYADPRDAERSPRSRMSDAVWRVHGVLRAALGTDRITEGGSGAAVRVSPPDRPGTAPVLETPPGTLIEQQIEAAAPDTIQAELLSVIRAFTAQRGKKPAFVVMHPLSYLRLSVELRARGFTTHSGLHPHYFLFVTLVVLPSVGTSVIRAVGHPDDEAIRP